MIQLCNIFTFLVADINYVQTMVDLIMNHTETKNKLIDEL